MNERNLSLFFSVLLSVCLFSSHQDVCVTLSLHLPLLQARRRAPRRCSVNICGKHKVCVMLFLGSLLRLCLSAPLILSLPSILASRCLCIPPPPGPPAVLEPPILQPGSGCSTSSERSVGAPEGEAAPSLPPSQSHKHAACSLGFCLVEHSFRL